MCWIETSISYGTWADGSALLDIKLAKLASFDTRGASPTRIVPDGNTTASQPLKSSEDHVGILKQGLRLQSYAGLPKSVL
jgi:hypothetical protein